MPISPQAQQLAQIMQALQAQSGMGAMQRLLTQSPQAQQQAPGIAAQTQSPTGQGQGLAALLGGMGAMGQPPIDPQAMSDAGPQ